MAELVIRLNLETEEVELVVDNKVLDKVEKPVVHSWVRAINEKNKPPAPPEPVAPEAPVEEKEVAPEAPVAEPVAEETKVEVDTNSQT